MNKNLIEIKYPQTFASLRQEKDGCEFWSARRLSKSLGYNDYQNFLEVIEKAKNACFNSGHSIDNHFMAVSEMIDIGSKSQQKNDDMRLSRYACYLIVQNGDPVKPVIAHGQTYFAIETRRRELADNFTFQQLKDVEKRLYLQIELREPNKVLMETARQAGVEAALDFAVFQNHGYKDLF